MNRFGVLIFTDIILGAIAILIVVIVINRPKNQATTLIPQADYVLVCDKIKNEQPSISILNSDQSTQLISSFLDSLQKTPQVAVRLLLQHQTASEQQRQCAKLIARAVAKTNKTYERDRKQITGPYIFFTETINLKSFQ